MLGLREKGAWGGGWGFDLERLKCRVPGGCRLPTGHSVNLLFQGVGHSVVGLHDSGLARLVPG